MRVSVPMCLVWLFPVLSFCVPAGAEELRASFLMLSDPAFEYPRQDEVLPPKIVGVWRKSLRRDEAAYRVAAAADIRKAHKAGFDEVKAAIPKLREILRDEDAGEDVWAQAALTLIELDARQAADELFEATRRSSSQFRQLVEPALARWDHRPIRKLWRERLKRASTPRREMVLACEGAGRVRDDQALTELTRIVHSSRHPQDVRLAAARAAGEIAESGLEDDVRRLLRRPGRPLVERLCAVALLQRHSSAEAQQLLVELFDDPAGPVAAAAIGRLLAIDPKLVVKLTERAWSHTDAKVRRTAAECLIRLPTEPRLRTLALYLNDPDPELRARIRDALLEFSRREDFAATVRQSVLDVLNSDGWRGQEQACLLLGQLDHEAAAERFTELLQSDRPEVAIASAWALRKVAVQETAAAMLGHAQRQTANPQGDDLSVVDRQVAHLFEGLAMLDYRPAIPLMRRYVPKEISHRRLSRGAAVWALGHLLADEANEEFAAQLMGRVNDDGGMPPEIEIVRRMSAISLGRMKAASQLEALKNKAGPTIGHDAVEYSLGWAIREISGESVPRDELAPSVMRGWKLRPVRR